MIVDYFGMTSECIAQLLHHLVFRKLRPDLRRLHHVTFLTIDDVHERIRVLTITHRARHLVDHQLVENASEPVRKRQRQHDCQAL